MPHPRPRYSQRAPLVWLNEKRALAFDVLRRVRLSPEESTETLISPRLIFLQDMAVTLQVPRLAGLYAARVLVSDTMLAMLLSDLFYEDS